MGPCLKLSQTHPKVDLNYFNFNTTYIFINVVLSIYIPYAYSSSTTLNQDTRKIKL